MFREIKRHVNKPDEVYVCELIARGPDWVLLKYVSQRDWILAGTWLPEGSATLALYRRGAEWVLWRISAPDGLVLGHVFHVCTDVEIGEAEVSYRDLLLDVWVDGQGRVTMLDEDEVAACVATGALTLARAATIADAGRRIGRNPAKLIEELDVCYSEARPGMID